MARRDLCRWDNASTRGICRPRLVSHRLIIDLSVECYIDDEDGTHFRDQYLRWALGLGGLMVVFYSIGIPCTMLYLLHRGRHILEVLKPVYGFLFSGFERNLFFWEVVILARKGAIAVVAVILVPAGADVQAYTALTVIALSLQLQIRHKPYVKP